MSHSILAIEMYVHVLWLPLIIIPAFLAGLLFRKVQLNKTRKEVLSLENEMMKNHAQILQLQQKIATVERSPTDPVTPVFPIKEQNEEKKDKPDVTQHKRVN